MKFTWDETPPPRARLAAALALGLLAAAVFFAHTIFDRGYVRGTAGDLGGALEGARRVLAGERHIYAEPFAPYVTRYPLEYPLPASLLLLPLAPLPAGAAGVVFTGLGTGLAAWFLTRRGWGGLLLFASVPALFAWLWAQWSPWLLLIGVAPGAGVLLACKPQAALAMLALRPSWRALAWAGALLAASLVWSPTWPFEWLAALRANPNGLAFHRGALFAPGGVLLLLAALKWRDPRARLLLVLAVVPNRLWFYEQLLLGLVPQTPRRTFAWAACTWLALAGWGAARMFVAGEAAQEKIMEALLVALVYGPALWCVLRPPAAALAPGVQRGSSST